ncbi:Ldh family oxidoreductase [Auraticoccus monumenti]|uniref:Malate/lactate/ureidoglycolate dehydrogenase, LDH2 family n=1 Tax=Auraticoccus monumenti TaxID=675864 RepID=A0A1G6S2Q6_9ACTN|nr:Ldh family oxidoreductase [Auraticoccus monumenti]SDD10963.1 Malate/lactate/ureidoglycolate dehydrogenase, LDH2 family [Auraticoccus monumenti]
MNEPPVDAVVVPAPVLQTFVTEAGEASGLSPAHAALLAGLLVDNDCRGVFSHGSTQLTTYSRLLREGRLNPDAEPAVVRETPTSLLVDGDGGLGYFAAHLGTRLLVERAREQGIAVLLTRDHGHFGAAGLYSRMTLEHDLLTFVTSGHQLDLQPGSPVFAAGGGSPMSFSAPTQDEDPVVLDFGAMHDLYDDSPHRDQISRDAPGLALRAIGLGAVCQAWGGVLAGVPLDPARARRRWAGANQGSLVISFRIDLFSDPADFRREMDAYVRAVRALSPLPGLDASLLPGGPEAQRERRFRAEGVPVGPEHRDRLRETAAELGLTAPC